MSSLSSPRLSITSARTPSPTSSRRASTEATHGINSAASARTASASPSVTHRRNRAALRDYYNIRPTQPDASHPNQAGSLSVPVSGNGDDQPVSPVAPAANTELDSPNFDPESYISHLLATSSLSTILRAENSLVNDIRTLDGERKALVYDNYSKLIKAVETIGKMRVNIEEQGGPMVMARTLAPAVGFVAETATSLIREQEETKRIAQEGKKESENGEGNLEKETVKWVLDTPRRLREFLAQEERQQAESDWGEIQAMLAKWEGVGGVKELREECDDIMKQE